MWILITYLIGVVALFTFCMLDYEDMDFSTTVFISVFYPIIILIWAILFVLLLLYGAVAPLFDLIMTLKERVKNGK